MDLRDLNAEQKAAVVHGKGPLLVVAGAGTGKTEVIARRIAYLIDQGKARPDAILALTFTEKAAGEMIDRLDILIGWSAHQVNVMTFHAFGAQLLLRYGHHIGRANRAELITKNIKMLLLRQHLSEIELSYYGSQTDPLDFLNGCVDYIEALQNNDITLTAFEKYVKNLEKSKTTHPFDLDEARDRLKLYELYENLKRRYSLIDYHDQIMLPLELLQHRPNIAAKLGEQYKHVLVDEYQDTNGSQDQLLRAFIAKTGNIFAVGDDDQAIYGFRGAKVENILNFVEHFEVKKPVVLVKNYRSTQKILDRAYKLIRHNDPERLEAKLGINKRLVAKLAGAEPEFKLFPSSQEEVNGLADALAERTESGEAPESIAVLSTTHSALQSLARVLRRRGLPHRLISTIKIFEQKELLQLWYLLRWLAFSADDEAATQLLLGPFFGWPASKVRAITELSRSGLISIEETLEQASAGNADAKLVCKLLEEWRGWSNELSVSELAYRLVTTTGLSEKWIKEAGNSPRMLRVFEDLQLLLRQMQEYESVAVDRSLPGFLSFFPQPPEIEASEVAGDEEGISLLTVHASKGLEFETVYLMNNTREAWTDLAIPSRVDLPEELKRTELDLPPEHERRRLLYVALTRAKTNLILSAPQYDRGGRNRKLSPFLPEMFELEEIKSDLPVQLTNKLEQTLEAIDRFAPAGEEWNSKRLPFETADGWLDLNITDLQKYLDCPYEFYLEKVLKISSPMGPAINFGSVLHQLFNEYYEGVKSGEKLSLKELQQRLEERWSNRGYRTAAEAETAKQRAITTLKSFFVREEARKEKLRSSEEPIRLLIPEAKLRLRGRIDASFDTEEGIQVRDFKTGRLRDAEKLSGKAKDNFQLRTYALATKEVTGQAPSEVVLDYVVTGVEGVAKLTPQILDNHRQKIIQIANDIRARKFEPNKSMYHKCIAHRYWGTGDDDAD